MRPALELVPPQGEAAERRSGITPLPAMQVPDPPLYQLPPMTESQLMRLLVALDLDRKLAGRAALAEIDGLTTAIRECWYRGFAGDGAA